MNFNLSQACSGFLSGLSSKQKEIISRRFGLKGGERETLEAIGRNHGITRERVRQIERDGIYFLSSKAEENQKVVKYFKDYLKKQGGVKKEEIALSDLGGEKQKNQAYFMLSLIRGLERFGEKEDFYPFWAFNKNSFSKARDCVNSVYKKLKEDGSPHTLKSLSSFSKIPSVFLNSYLEISKKIFKSQENLFGLKDWPEINPRGVKDKAVIAFKKEQKPLHFKNVAQLIGSALPQTVHNELIKDPRFVLVGRGVYALNEWGYESGAVKDVIAKVIRENKKPLAKENILKEVLKQRMVKENTVLLNLSNRKYFKRNNRGFYDINTNIA